MEKHKAIVRDFIVGFLMVILVGVMYLFILNLV